MLNAFSQVLHQLGGRVQAFEQSLFRKQIVLPFLLARLALIAVMLIGFYLAFAGTHEWLVGFQVQPLPHRFEPPVLIQLY